MPARRRPTCVADIQHGDRVTIVDRFQQEHTGRAVMRSQHGGWVLNLGGPHGTPGIADGTNVVRIVRPRARKGVR
jgi:hypothetical protein